MDQVTPQPSKQKIKNGGAAIAGPSVRESLQSEAQNGRAFVRVVWVGCIDVPFGCGKDSANVGWLNGGYLGAG